MSPESIEQNIDLPQLLTDAISYVDKQWKCSDCDRMIGSKFNRKDITFSCTTETTANMLIGRCVNRNGREFVISCLEGFLRKHINGPTRKVLIQRDNINYADLFIDLRIEIQDRAK